MAREIKDQGCETRYGPEPECIQTESGRTALGGQASNRAVVGQRALCIEAGDRQILGENCRLRPSC